MSDAVSSRKLLNALMCAALDRAALSDDESFFDAGGNSLLAARLVAGIGSRLGVATTVQAVYEHPTVTRLAEHLAGAEPAVEPLVAGPRPEVVPLAPVQRRLWFHNRLHPEDASYNMVAAVRIEGPLDVDALRAALTDLVLRHEVLRTVYPDWDGAPEQVVLTLEEGDVELTVRSVSAGQAIGLVSAAADIGFDVTVDTPLRAVLVREEPTVYVLGLVIHHIACDGWSLSPLWADVASAYRRRVGAGAEPERLPVQYADYALWRTDAMARLAEAGDLELAYWRRELRHPPAVPVLDGMRPRRGSPSNRGGELRRRLSAELHLALETRARELSASPFMLMHAALAVALRRMGARDDSVIGTPVAGRSDPGLDPLVGFFVNTLTLRVDLSGNPTFEGLVARVRATDLAALAHDVTPFDVVLQDLNPPREGGWVPLIGVMLAYQNTPQPELDLPGLRCENLAVPTRNARFDVRLEVVERRGPGGPAGLDLTATWMDDVASRAVAERLVDRLRQVLTEALDNPGRRLRVLGRSDGAVLDPPPAPSPGAFPTERSGRPRIAFVCSPFGQQWVGMGRAMLELEPVFAQAIDECRAELAKHASWDVREELARPAETSRLEDVTIGQPLAFAVQVALARWLEHRGVTPTVVTGHSLGEIAASVVSGVLDLPDAARLVYHYARQQGRLAGRGGGMLVVEWPAAKLEQYRADGFEDVVVAAVNGPRTTALAGPRDRLAALKEELQARSVLCAWIRVDVAAHGPDIDAVLPALVRGAGGISCCRPRLPMVSSVTGRELDWRDVGPEYFATNLRQQVRLADAVGAVLAQPTGALVEISANPILVPALAQCVDEAGRPTHVLGSMRRSDVDDRIGPVQLVDFLGGADRSPARSAGGPDG